MRPQFVCPEIVDQLFSGPKCVASLAAHIWVPRKSLLDAIHVLVETDVIQAIGTGDGDEQVYELCSSHKNPKERYNGMNDAIVRSIGNGNLRSREEIQESLGVPWYLLRGHVAGLIASGHIKKLGAIGNRRYALAKEK